MAKEGKETEVRLAQLLELAIELEPGLFSEVARIATTDESTGAYAESFFDAHFRNELNRAHVLQYPLGVLLLEIRPEDEIDFQHRSMTEDEMLKSVAQVIEAKLRVTDWLARTGEDEIVVVLPGCSQYQLKRIAEEILSALESLSFTLHDGQNVQPQLYVGGSAYSQGPPDAEELLSALEWARAGAKDIGPGHIVVRGIEPWSPNQTVV